MKTIWWLLFSSVFFAFGEFYSKKYALGHSWKVLVLIFSFYMVSVWLWLKAICQTKELAVTGSVWSVLSLVITVLLGVLFFDEKLHLMHWIGLAFAMISVYMLSI